MFPINVMDSFLNDGIYRLGHREFFKGMSSEYHDCSVTCMKFIFDFLRAEFSGQTRRLQYPVLRKV